jgi:hypothetical protein
VCLTSFMGNHTAPLTKRGSPAGARRQKTDAVAGNGQCYLEFELDRAQLETIQRLARRAGCTPFEMCVKLIERRLSRRNGADCG